MDSESPPRKKLKQARLPFQILSHKDSSADTKSPTPSRKRPLSEDSQEEEVVAVKVGKKSEDTKENETVVTPPTEVDLENKDHDLQNGTKSTEVNTVIPESPVKESIDSTNAQTKPETKETKSEKKSELPSFLMNMKANLADLLEKKVLDFNADVGSCDCGCEEEDSAGSALEEYYEHCNKKKATPKSSEKKSRRKSGHKSDSKQSSPSKQPKQQSPRGKKKASNSPKSAEPLSKTVTPEKTADDVPVSESKLSPLNSTAEKSSILSKKAADMFAKWRKPSNDISQKSENAAEDSKNINGSSDLKSSGFSVVHAEEVKAEVVKDAGAKSGPSSIGHSPKKFKLSNASDNVQEKTELQESVKPQPKSENDVVELSDSSFEEKTPLKGKKPESNSSFTGILKKSDEAGCLDNSIVVDEDKTLTLTPTGLSKTPQRRLTPKQIERQKEVARKQEEKEKQRLERENEKKRLKLEKEELKKKEKEEKEEQRRREKEEKEKKKQAEQELKIEEKKKKELQKAEEKRKKDEDKKKAEEEEERKKAKASALFTSFFVPKSTKPEREDPPPPTETKQNFMPFEVKADMRVAPPVRHTLSSPEKQCLDEVVKQELPKSKDCLYLASLKSGESVPKTGSKTWPLDDNKEDDDISIIESDDAGVLVSDIKKVEKMRAKYLLFHENHRPAYRGTWRKKSLLVTGRHPFGQDKIFDYEVDSADEWEEEEPGESLHGSDDEKDKESEDEYEVDNGIFVPHGYLSDDEGDAEENEETFNPETQKAKLKLLGEEFEAQMKSKTSTLKPIIIVLTAALQASSCSARYQKLLERRAVWQEDEGPIALTQFKSDNDNGEGLTLNAESNCVTFSSGPGAKKKIIAEEAIPALITLVHGNQNKRVFLTNEFSAFLGKSQSGQVENIDENPALSESAEPQRPSTPSTSCPNPLLQKWPGLPPASRISISNKIKEIGLWGPCPEEGPFYGRQCWYVKEEIRTKYGLTDLKLPNTLWHYTLKPKVLNYSHSPSSAAVSNPTSSRALITNFTKVMTPEEKKRQWEAMKSPAPSTPSSSKPLSAKGSTGKITAFTQHLNTPGSAEPSKVSTSSAAGTPTSNQPQAKKRVALLVSVPRGQQIASSSHCSLLSKFEASASPKSTAAAAAPSEPSVASQVPVPSVGTSDVNIADSKMDDECIVLD
ncbi:chromatin assembly factor 1 subunit A [Thrips palmi]|uniref:Chromatin assembly factor 1 subunit A n=1 Tax=Thrips palmi TaxID=161013 RepID=A0A6P8YVX1_THRPL|nr:chromatin assembly factor 1 subunit A [Thrips palmi]XP_034241346.1 chromatin assembly factor 1 subunit A [Thrips palmi]